MTTETKLDQLKADAKNLKRKRNIAHSAALEITARRYGCSNYHEARQRLKDIPRD